MGIVMRVGFIESVFDRFVARSAELLQGLGVFGEERLGEGDVLQRADELPVDIGDDDHAEGAAATPCFGGQTAWGAHDPERTIPVVAGAGPAGFDQLARRPTT